MTDQNRVSLVGALSDTLGVLSPEVAAAKGVTELSRAFVSVKHGNRARKLAKEIDLCSERMSSYDRDKFIQLMKNPSFQIDILEYIESALNTPSDILIRAFALMVLDDSDCRLNEEEKMRFTVAFNGLTDQAVKIFLSLTKAKRIETKLYDIHIVGKEHPLTNDKTPPELLLMMTQSFLNRGILLPDHANSDSGMSFAWEGGDPKDWYIRYGISDETRKYAALIEKAIFLGDTGC